MAAAIVGKDAVTPPAPWAAFVEPSGDPDASRLILSGVAIRFLQNITQAINGSPHLDVSPTVQLTQFAFGDVTLSTGNIVNPLGNVPGNIGDLCVSTDGSAGVLFAKTTGAAGDTTGWVKVI